MSRRNLRRLIPWLQPYRTRLALAMLAVIGASLAAVMMPLVVSRVLIDHLLLPQAPAQGVAGASFDLGLVHAMEALSRAAGLTPLAATVGLYAFWAVVAGGLGHVFRTQSASATLAALNDLRQALFRHIVQRPATFFDRQSTAQLGVRLTQDIEALNQMVAGLISLVGELVPFVIALWVLQALDVPLLLELVPLMGVVVAASWLFRRLVTPLFEQLRQQNGRLNEHLHDHLTGAETVQLFNRQGLNGRRWNGLVDASCHLETQAFRAETSYYPLLENLWNLAVAVILWFGARHLGQGAISLGAVVLFVSYSDLLFKPIVELGMQMDTIWRARIASGRILQVLDDRTALMVPAQPHLLSQRLHGAIELRGLRFAYPHEPQAQVLHGVHLSIAPGERVALVGPTGSGKTTLARLLTRQYDVPPGQLLMDGHDVMAFDPQALRARIGTVLQDVHLFPASVADNIAMGRAGVDRAAIRRAAQAVQALEFIECLPQGFDTLLDDRGTMLSHGERQLLALARLMVQAPDIVVLDEATAHIDRGTERAVQQALAKVMAGRTSVVIAHRLQTIIDADRIVVLEAGRVRAQGTHVQLLASDALYQRLWMEGDEVLATPES